jgi:hypothetical protein
MNTKLNPLQITDDPFLNKTHHLPNCEEMFEKDISSYFNAIAEKRGSVGIGEFVTVMVYFTIDLLIEYRDNAHNTLPISIIEDMKSQIINVLQRNYDAFNRPDIIDEFQSLLEKKMYEPNIESETQHYLNRVRQY